MGPLICDAYGSGGIGRSLGPSGVNGVATAADALAPGSPAGDGVVAVAVVVGLCFSQAF